MTTLKELVAVFNFCSNLDGLFCQLLKRQVKIYISSVYWPNPILGGCSITENHKACLALKPAKNGISDVFFHLKLWYHGVENRHKNILNNFVVEIQNFVRLDDDNHGRSVENEMLEWKKNTFDDNSKACWIDIYHFEQCLFGSNFLKLIYMPWHSCMAEITIFRLTLVWYEWNH